MVPRNCITGEREPVLCVLCPPFSPSRLRLLFADPNGGLQGIQAWSGRRGLRELGQK